MIHFLKYWEIGINNLCNPATPQNYLINFLPFGDFKYYSIFLSSKFRFTKSRTFARVKIAFPDYQNGLLKEYMNVLLAGIH